MTLFKSLTKTADKILEEVVMFNIIHVSSISITFISIIRLRFQKTYAYFELLSEPQSCILTILNNLLLQLLSLR